MKVVKQNKYLHINMITPIFKYGFSAECVNDIIEFQKNLILSGLYKFNGWNFNYSMYKHYPDVDCELEIDL